MSVVEVSYCSRDDVKRALDIKQTARNDSQVDRAIQDVSRDIEGRLHRKFYPVDATRYFDWPNYAYAYPWRIWFDQNDLVSVTALVAGGITITSDQYFLEPVNSGPPYTYIELDRSKSASFGGNSSTPQHAVAITGTWGYHATKDAVTTLAAAITTTTAATVTVSDGSQIGPGNVLVIDSERLLVTDRSYVSTGATLAGPGTETAIASDTQLTASSANAFAVGEVLRIDSEWLLVVDQLDTTNYTVKRAWDGSVLTTHTNGTAIYASRQLSVTRGALGTTAATHSNAATVSRHRVPPLIRDLAIAEAGNVVLQETSGYSRTVGEGDSLRPASGSALAIKWDKAITAYGRKARIRVG